MKRILQIRPSRGFSVAAALALAGALSWSLASARSEEPAQVVPAAVVDEPASTASYEKAVFAGGCFWGVQGVFQHLNGVKNAVSGYAGGAKNTADYETVSGGNSGHAESVEVTYDPKLVTYGQLLQVFFSVAHDPTQLNRQGPDSGTQYRSAIFVANDSQKKVAESYIAQLDKAGVYHNKIATRVEPLKGFYKAEDHHQNFLALNPRYPYIVYNDLPKVENLQKLFPDRYRKEPVLVKLS